MLGARTFLNIEYNGTNISTDLNKDVTNFTYEDNLDCADSISLTIIDKEKKWAQFEPLKGDKIKVLIKVFEGEETQTLDCGVFSVDEFDIFGPPDSIEIKATSVDISSELKEAKSKAWSALKLDDIAKEIAENNNLSLEFDSETIYLTAPSSSIAGAGVRRFEQIEEGDGAFLQRVCKEYGLCMKVFNSKMIIFKEKDYETKMLARKINKKEVLSYRFANSEYSTCDKVVIEYFDPSLPASIKVEEEIQKEGYNNKKKPKVLKFNENFGAVGTKLEQENFLKEIAINKLRENNKGEIKALLELKGDTRLVAGLNIELEAFGNRDMKYIIEKATHKVSGGYKTSIDARKVLDY